MSEWRVGVAEREITPPLGVSLTGYAGRPGPADHVLDPLRVRALAIETDGELAVLTGADLLGLPAAMVEHLRGMLADVVSPDRLLLNHSHTHAGPTTAPLRCMGTPDLEYARMMLRLSESAVREAIRDVRPARLLFGTAETAIGMNRRECREGRIVLGENPQGAYDPGVYVLRVEEPDGKPLACWFSHGTHPVVMGPQNTGLSAEWPGIAAGILAGVLGCPAVFAQGCCGDINPVRRGDHSVVRSVGRELAGAALAAWERAEPLEGRGIASALETARLPQRKPTVEEAELALEEARARVRGVEAELAVTAGQADNAEARRRLEIPREMLGWADDYRKAADSPEEPSVGLEVQAIRLGDLLLVATGAETFVEIGMEIQRRAPLRNTVALGYTNGCFGYLPTAREFPRGGYEVDGAHKYYGTLMVTPDGERLGLEAAERVMARTGTVRPE